MVGGRILYLTLTKGMLGHDSQIKNQRFYIYIYFAQLRYHHENTDMCGEDMPDGP